MMGTSSRSANAKGSFSLGAVLLDTNLLLLLAVGRVDPALIARHKNLQGYAQDDFDLLVQQLMRATRLLVTPHILAETSNLLAQIGEPIRSRLMSEFQALIANFDVIEEIHIPSATAAARKEFVRLGLTDSALLVEQDIACTILTADAKLHVTALHSGRDCVNFNHLRDSD
jgi:hypothetical protein